MIKPYVDISYLPEGTKLTYAEYMKLVKPEDLYYAYALRIHLPPSGKFEDVINLIWLALERKVIAVINGENCAEGL